MSDEVEGQDGKNDLDSCAIVILQTSYMENLLGYLQ